MPETEAPQPLTLEYVISKKVDHACKSLHNALVCHGIGRAGCVVQLDASGDHYSDLDKGMPVHLDELCIECVKVRDGGVCGCRKCNEGPRRVTYTCHGKAMKTYHDS